MKNFKNKILVKDLDNYFDEKDEVIKKSIKDKKKQFGKVIKK